MLNIVDAIRKMCEPEQGFVELFDKEKSFGKLCELTDERKSLELFEKLFYGKARNNLIELINDSYQYKVYEKKILDELSSDGLSAQDSILALEIFYKTFGYPGYRDMDINIVKEFVSYDSGNFKSIYNGETINGQEYGVGIRKNYYEGKSCGFDECVWINGKMLGYCYALDIEFMAFETKKYGFVLNDYYIGKMKEKYSDGEEEYLDGKLLIIK